MTETKFTPGPWLSGHLGSDSKCQCQSILAEGYMGCIATVEVDNGRPVSDGGNDAPPLEEAVANMHLIAASPMLYRYLAEVRKWMDTDEFGPWEAAFCAEIDAVLAKARGEA